MIFFKSEVFKSIMLILLVTIGLLAIGIYFGWRNNNLVTKCPKIVIGKIVGTSSVFDSGSETYVIDYWYMNKVYRTSAMDIPASNVGDLYFVKVSCIEPERDQVTNIRVPESIKSFPAEGWDKFPPELEKLDDTNRIFFLRR